MKTNVLMQSKDRVLLGVNVSVMSKDEFMCITELMKALNDKRVANGFQPKKINKILSTSDFNNRLISVIKVLDERKYWRFPFGNLHTYSLNISSLGDLKKISLAYRRGKREDQKWFVHSFIFIMIALEMDPDLYGEVILWINDGLIQSRNNAGDSYKLMCRSIDKLISRNERVDRFKEVARAINHIVFNEHKEGIRNEASLKELNDIALLENTISSIIDNGLIPDFESLIDYLRREWTKRWKGKIISIDR